MRIKRKSQTEADSVRAIDAETSAPEAYAANNEIKPANSPPPGKSSKEILREIAVEDEKIIKVIRALLYQDEEGRTFH